MNRPVGEGEANLASDQNQEGVVDQFVEITGVDRHRARFYLDTAAFNLPLALSAFYEGGFEDASEADPEVIFDQSADDVQIVHEPTDDSGEPAIVSGQQQDIAMSGNQGEKDKKKFGSLFSGGGPSGRQEGGSSDEDGDDKGQAFYVGGSSESGQQVLGPPKKKDGNLVEKFFQQAREKGAEQIDASKRSGASAGASGSDRSFGGPGYRLGDAVKPTVKVGDKPLTSQDAEPEIVTVVMRMWQNGFTIDDGELRTFDGPTERQFLEHIMQGRLPPELLQIHRGKRIDLEMEDHRNEEFKPQKRAVKAFSGQGHTLGSPVPQVVGAGSVGVKAEASSGASGGQQAQAPPVDESKPTTSIQVRLGNGERLVLKLNNHHTVKDLRQFICQMRPDLANREFALMTNFPNKELTNEISTLEEANLLNAVIIQRFK